jgi:hypothetical protein
MTDHSDQPTVDLDLDQMASLVGLTIPPEYRAGVQTNFERIQAIAELVMEFPLPEAIEPAVTTISLVA